MNGKRERYIFIFNKREKWFQRKERNTTIAIEYQTQNSSSFKTSSIERMAESQRDNVSKDNQSFPKIGGMVFLAALKLLSIKQQTQTLKRSCEETRFYSLPFELVKLFQGGGQNGNGGIKCKNPKWNFKHKRLDSFRDRTQTHYRLHIYNLLYAQIHVYAQYTAYTCSPLTQEYKNLRLFYALIQTHNGGW